MFRTIGDRPSPWEGLLPAELLRLPEELARVDALLDDPAFFAPFAPHLHPVLGRPSTPVELTFTASSGLTPLLTSGSAASSKPRRHSGLHNSAAFAVRDIHRDGAVQNTVLCRSRFATNL